MQTVGQGNPRTQENINKLIAAAYGHVVGDSCLAEVVSAIDGHLTNARWADGQRSAIR